MSPDKLPPGHASAQKPGPPMPIRWLAFLGWLTLPILATAAVARLTELAVLWWGPVWFGFALAYTIVYFRWARRRFPKE